MKLIFKLVVDQHKINTIKSNFEITILKDNLLNVKS